MEPFKTRFSLKFRSLNGEAISAEQGAMAREMSHIDLTIITYVPYDVWNSDEFVLLCSQLSTRTQSNGPISGFKKEKTGITILECCNYDGSESIPLIIIERAWKPRQFK